MVGYVASSYALTSFCLLMAGLLLYAGYRAPQKFHKIPLRALLIVNALLYFGMAHLAVTGAVGYAVEETVMAPCEYVVANSTAINENMTEYAYADSCDGLSAAEPVVQTLGIYLYFTYFVYAQLILFIILWSIMWWGDRW
jgi:hypothetical protein